MALDGKTAIVTGGAAGIGRAVVRRFLDDGARVVIADVDEDKGEETARDLEDYGDVRFVHCDVGERLDVHNLVASTLDAFDDIDILVNNAGIVHKADFLELKEEDFDRVMRVNLKGAFLCGQAVAQHLVERVGEGDAPGAIVNMSSVNAVFGLPDQAPYSISKGGLSQLTKVMSIALAPHGIRVNAVGPGSVMTEMLERVVGDEEARERILSRTPIGRIGRPEEVAACVAWLASDEASYVTGHTLYADGGRLGLNYTMPPPSPTPTGRGQDQERG